jgi:hypothetical protein
VDQGTVPDQQIATAGQEHTRFPTLAADQFLEIGAVVDEGLAVGITTGQDVAPAPVEELLVREEMGALVIHQGTRVGADVLQWDPGRCQMTQPVVVMDEGEVLMQALLAAFPESEALNQARFGSEEFIEEADDRPGEGQGPGGIKIAVKVVELQSGRSLAEVGDTQCREVAEHSCLIVLGFAVDADHAVQERRCRKLRQLTQVGVEPFEQVWIDDLRKDHHAIA